MEKVEFINIADVKNPNTGKTYREENEEKTHKIGLRTLVEVITDEDESKYNGIRAFVVSHDRDCDGTPLYSISLDRDWKPGENKKWTDEGGSYIYQGELIQRAAKEHGFPEGCLREVSGER